MCFQGLDRVIRPCQLGLGQCGMDLIVANLVKADDWPALAAFQPRHEVVQTRLRFGWNGAPAQRANRIIRVQGLYLCQRLGMSLVPWDTKTRGDALILNTYDRTQIVFPTRVYILFNSDPVSCELTGQRAVRVGVSGCRARANDMKIRDTTRAVGSCCGLCGAA